MPKIPAPKTLYKIRLVDGPFWTETEDSDRGFTPPQDLVFTDSSEVLNAIQDFVQSTPNLEYIEADCLIAEFDAQTQQPVKEYRYEEFLNKGTPMTPNTKLKTEADALQLITEHGGHQFKNIPQNLRSEAVCLAAVKDHPYALAQVPKELKTYSMCDLAVSIHDGQALHHVPEEHKDFFLCKHAADRSMHVLDTIIDKYKDPHTTTTALKMSASLIGKIPLEHEYIVKNCLTYCPGLAPHLAGTHWDTEAIRLFAVEQSPYVIQDFSEEQLSSAIVWQAVLQDASCLNVLPNWVHDDFLNAKSPGLAQVYRQHEGADGCEMADYFRGHLVDQGGFKPNQNIGCGASPGYTIPPTHRIVKPTPGMDMTS